MTFRRAAALPNADEKALADKAAKDREPVVQPLYKLALDLSEQLFLIVELTAAVERFHLRDKLDKSSTAIPVTVARALATKDMSDRRAFYREAHQYVTECMAILDILLKRGTIEPEPFETARATGAALCAKLDRLGDRWRETLEP